MSAVYLSSWSEDRILAYFWTMVREGVDRLELLQQLATVAVRRPPSWDRRAIRAVADHGIYPQMCFYCCTGDRNLYWHHVIEVQHGGSNDRLNLVAICLRCHATVHPWLDGTRDDQRHTTWVRVGAAGRRVLRDIEVEEIA